MARHGLILWENEATGLNIIFLIYIYIYIFFLIFAVGLGVREVYKNDLELRGVISPKYEPVASHGDPFQARFSKF